MRECIECGIEFNSSSPKWKSCIDCRVELMMPPYAHSLFRRLGFDDGGRANLGEIEKEKQE